MGFPAGTRYAYAVAMSPSRRSFASVLVVASSLASAFVPGLARAQTVTPLNMGIPYRLDSKGSDVSGQERPQNQMPTGISFNDCITDMSVGFPIQLSGFAGQGLEVWVGNQDCTQDMARGHGAVPVCWKVAEVGAMNVQTVSSTQINVRMQNIVGPQKAPPTTGVLVNETSSACYAQQSYASVQFNVAFVPVTSAGILSGTGTSFTVNTDLVGPPAPTGISSSTGDTLFVVNWTPNTDPDTAGYDIYVGSVAQLTSGGGGSDGGYTLVCTEAGASGTGGSIGGSSGGGADASTDGSADGSAVPDGAIADATVFDSSSSGGSSSGGGVTCTNVVNNPTPGCGGTIFSQSFVSDGGRSVTAPISDDAGDDATTTIPATGGGISQIPTKYLVNANGTTTVTISSASVGSYNITGLTNNIPYAAVVAAVDGFGNIGPPSVQRCDMPQPVNDFYKVYRMDGGTAGGGFCALDALGAPTGPSVMSSVFGALAFSLFRRRRRRRN
jgi:hypothetical protein